MSFATMKVWQKLALGFASTLAMLLAVAGVSGYAIYQTSAATERLLGEQLQTERMIQEWKSITEANLPRALAAGMTAQPAMQQFFQSAMEVSKQRGDAVTRDVGERLVDPVMKKLYAVALKKRDEYVALRGQGFDLKTTGADAEVMRHYFDGIVTPAATAFSDSIEQVAQQQRALLNQTGVDIQRRGAQAGLWVGMLSVAALALSVLFAALIVRSLLRQLGGEPAYAAAIADRIAAGELSVEVTLRAGDQHSLLFSIDAMRQRLAVIVRQVRGSAEQVVTASGEIAQGNLDLSSRTEQQASTLEQTAASMEELTSTVRQNSANARTANQLALTASSIAVQGGTVVSQVVVTMDGINQSARKIAEINGVIDGIAFQTNILALNAAVEAARAGEQGRGFAVVASEVRNLAQRSAAAAREIKSLIAASVEQVEAGSKLVSQAGATMDEVVGSVRRVTDIMSEITLAGQEQSTGIEQVNQAISAMDTVTQQNAALVEQAAAAAHGMRDQATALAQLVSVFQLDGVPAQRPDARQAGRRPPPRQADVDSLRLPLGSPA